MPPAGGAGEDGDRLRAAVEWLSWVWSSPLAGESRLYLWHVTVRFCSPGERSGRQTEPWEPQQRRHCETPWKDRARRVKWTQTYLEEDTREEEPRLVKEGAGLAALSPTCLMPGRLNKHMLNECSITRAEVQYSEDWESSDYMQKLAITGGLS